MKKISLEISENAYRKLYSDDMVARMKGEPGVSDLLLFKVLDAIENNKDAVQIKAKEGR